MILKDLLKNSKGTNIKVGASSMFVYCDICDETIDEKLDKIGTRYLNQFKARVETLKAKKVLSETEQKEFVEITNFLDNYTPLLEREVIYCVNGISKDEPNTKVIKVNGLEVGRFWTLKEFQRKKAKVLG